MDVEVFDDGATMELFSRESLAYRYQGYMVQVEFDYFKCGTFKTGRKIICDSVSNWEEYPPGESAVISADIKKKIIERAAKYFSERKLPVELVV